MNVVIPFAVDYGWMVLNGVQAAVTHIQSNNPRVFEIAYKARYVFQTLSCGAIFCYTMHTIQVLASKLQLASHEALFGTLSLMGLGMFAVASVVFINKVFRPKEDPKALCSNLKEDPDVKIEWGNSSYQCWQQGFYITQIVNAVALACLSTSPLYYGLNTAFLTYSLIKTTQWKWLHFERTFHLEDQGGEGPLAFAISYFYQLIPSAKAGGECSVCLENDPPPRTYFCPEHLFHEGCIADAIYAKTNDFVHRLEYKRAIMVETRNGFETDRYPKYTVSIPRTSIPQCPDCRRQPPQNEVHVTVKDRYQGYISHRIADVKLVGTV